MKIRILQHNVRSIRQNYEELKNMIDKNNYDIIALQETWIKTKQVFPKFKGYNKSEMRRKKWWSSSPSTKTILLLNEYLINN